MVVHTTRQTIIQGELAGTRCNCRWTWTKYYYAVNQAFFFERFWSLLFYKIRQKLSFLNFQWVFREKYSVFLTNFGEFLLFVTEFSIFSQKMKILPKNCTKMSVFYWCYCCYIEKICENLSFWLFLAWVLPKTVSFLKFVSSFSSEFFSKRSKKKPV